MTIIELIDAAPIHNIMGALAFNADKIIYVGSENKNIFENNRKNKIEKFYSKKGLKNVSFEYVQISKADFNDVRTKLNKIVAENDSCYFDISGGEDIVLSALGFVFAENPDIHLYKVNPETKRIYLFESQTDADGNRKIVNSKILTDIQNTVEENILAHGGTVVYDTEKPGSTHIWQFSVDFLKDLRQMWEICCYGPNGKNSNKNKNNNNNDKQSHPRMWNSIISTLEKLQEINNSKNENELQVNIEYAKNYLKKRGGYTMTDGYLYALQRAMLISFGENHSDEVLHIVFKNEQVKLCLTKAGTVLELKTYFACEKLLKDEFTDCMTGVAIDWDGIVHKEATNAQEYEKLDVQARINNIEDTKNEVDVILMKGLIPYFISCKNGKFTSEELYKLYTVKEKFGTEYGKMFIVTTDFDKSDYEFNLEHLSQRAADMGIEIIKNVHLMTDAEFEEELSVKLKKSEKNTAQSQNKKNA